jgi:hypothetical protein
VSGPRPSSGGPPGAAAPALATHLALGAALAASTIVAAEVAPWALLIVVAVASGIAGAEMGAELGDAGLSGSPLLYAAGVMIFPVAAYLWREPGLSSAAAVLMFLAAGRFVLSRPERAAVESIAGLILSALYIGFGTAYLILLRREADGARLVAGLVLGSAVYHACRWVGDRYVGKRSMAPHLPGSPTFPGVALGLIGCLAVTPGILVLLHRHIHPLLVLQIGLPLGAGLTLGTFAWALVGPVGSPVERSILPRQTLCVIQAVAVAAPALFYAAHLALR